MNTSFLKSLSLEQEDIDKVMAENGKDIAKEQAKYEAKLSDYDDKTLRVNELEKELKEAQKQAAEVDAWKSKYEQEVEAHNQTKETASTATADWEKKWAERDEADTAKETASKKRAAARSELIKRGANPDAVDDFMLDKLDYDGLELDGDTIKGADDYVKPYQERYAKYFGTTVTKGADVATPPANNPTEKDPFLAGFDED